MRRIIAIVAAGAVLLLGLGTVAIAQSETFLDGKVRTGDRITVGADEVIDGDLYVFAGDITINGTVTGDVVVFGGQVGMSGEIGGDLIAGAGTVDIDGDVLGDVRVGAGQLQVDGSVSEDVFAGVGRLRIDGTVGGDVAFGAGQVLVPGVVGGDVFGSTANYDRAGTVGGTEDVTIQETSERERPGPVTRALRQFGSLLVLGLLIVFLARRRFAAAITAVDEQAGSVVLRGLLFLAALVMVPVGVTLVGVLLALIFGWIGLGLVVAVLALAIVATWVLVVVSAILMIAVFAPIAASTWLASRLLPADTPAYASLAAGLAVLVVLLQIPVLGPLVGLAVTVIGAGAWLATVERPAVAGITAAVERPADTGGSIA
jgi:hypothetical protein